MQAPKNGFFYVLDRATGELISAEADRADQLGHRRRHEDRPADRESRRRATARRASRSSSIPARAARTAGSRWLQPADELVYLPVKEAAFPYIPDKEFRSAPLASIRAWTSTRAACRTDEEVDGADEGRPRAIWPRGTRSRRKKSGARSTSIRGTAARSRRPAISCSRATRGRVRRIQSGRVRSCGRPRRDGRARGAGDLQVDGEQYVAIEVGWGGAFGLAAGALARDAHIAANAPRVLAFKLGGTAMPPPGPPPPRLEPPPDVAAAARTKRARRVSPYCGTCHGDRP